MRPSTGVPRIVEPIGHALIGAGRRPRVMTRGNAGVGMAQPFGRRHHAKPLSDPGAVRGTQIVGGDALKAGSRSRWIEDRPAPRVVPQCVAGSANKDQCIRFRRPGTQVPFQTIGDESRESDRAAPVAFGRILVLAAADLLDCLRDDQRSGLGFKSQTPQRERFPDPQAPVGE
jgi:hypothetical protein